MSRPRRQPPPNAAYTNHEVAIPDWPKALQLPERVVLPDAAFEALAAKVAAPPSPNAALRDLSKRTEPAPLVAFLFVRTKDGRHLAAEAEVDGSKVAGLTPLCCSIHAQESAKAWEACAFARLCHARDYTSTERHANATQGKGARLEDMAEGYAVALVKRAGKTVALAMEVDGATVKEPKVLGSGDRLYAWQEVHAFAQRWFLPRRKAK